MVAAVTSCNDPSCYRFGGRCFRVEREREKVWAVESREADRRFAKCAGLAWSVPHGPEISGFQCLDLLHTYDVLKRAQPLKYESEESFPSVVKISNDFNFSNVTNTDVSHSWHATALAKNQSIHSREIEHMTIITFETFCSPE